MKPGNQETSKGIKHIFEAAGYTFDGLKCAFKETAFLLECGFGLAFFIVAWLLPFSVEQIGILTLAWLGVMVVELLNTAIEAVVDLASPEYHELAKRAKDLASAAVAVAIFANVILWAAFLWDVYCFDLIGQI